MFRLIARRLLMSVPTLAGIVLVTFALTRLLPGDPAAYFAGNAASVEAVEQIRHKLGLDQPLATQFLRYVRELATGDWGQSLSTGQPVATEIATRLPASLELTLVALLASLSVSIPLGVLAATRPGSWIDQLCRLVTTAGVSLPVFFTGLLLSFVFYFLLGWAPSPLGRIDPYVSAPATITGFYLIDSALAGDGAAFVSSARQLILPALTLALFVMAPVARMTRASMLGVLSADFVRTARAMGLSRMRVLYGYAFQNALLPVLTTIGMVFSFMLGANVLVEKVFAWPGIGSFAVESLVASDYAPVQGFVLTMAILYVALNLAIDLLYLAIDPRVTVEG
ncbi:MAG: ABC transporter permease [Burkholderiaceae bacterium]|nr:ABC transporter permease [Burkholderiaceae bacterium]MBP6815696.1 ABC transporter permease [Burkholderiaceae bacterium]MBP7660770.1 ABC transporter permease [Burkholderiaceae bacterium]